MSDRLAMEKHIETQTFMFLLYLAVIFSVLLAVVCFTEIKSGTFNRPSCAEPGEPQTHRANGARRPINCSN